ncbi:DUF2288 domain-containing protein [Myxosarcina sp. GI1]|uniref:DUF2288 domain-containing protein n=1 Tax=Myxosarcina sp. GI1 TaxID=1541065 RepID=UPI00056C6B0C|nr:DUF2288 domain-containing protein [Myxosarcina sp. GI1]
MPDIQDRLSQDLANIAWKDLIPHAKRDAVIVVTKTLNLVDVGAAIAKDNSCLVKNWIDRQKIGKPSSQQLADWNLAPQKQFATLIVQPFVLVQELAE